VNWRTPCEERTHDSSLKNWGEGRGEKLHEKKAVRGEQTAKFGKSIRVGGGEVVGRLMGALLGKKKKKSY